MKRLLPPRSRPVVAVCVCGLTVFVSACGGGGGAPPPPGPVLVAPAKLAFLTTGAAAAQTFTVSQANSNGPFTTGAGTCAGAVTIAQTGATAFSVTPVLSAICTLVVSGANGQTAAVAVSITTTSGTGS